jgi:hydroxymethylglutaryl-CoA synthase
MAMDMEFACKAATAGVQAALAQVKNNGEMKALVVGTDVAQARPGDVLELSAGAGAAAVLLGTREVLAEVEGYTSVASDLPDFWRREGERYPKHGGRFSGEPAFFEHVIGATRKLMESMKLEPHHIDQVVLHMPNRKFPFKAAGKLGFSEEKLISGMTIDEVGNPYSAAVLLGLVRVLSRVKANQRILVSSYGSGAGADCMMLRTTKWVETKRYDIDSLFEKRKEIEWLRYLEMRRQG